MKLNVEIEKTFSLTFKATIELGSHGYVARPRRWTEADEACPDWWVEFVVHNSVPVTISNEFLTER